MYRISFCKILSGFMILSLVACTGNLEKQIPEVEILDKQNLSVGIMNSLAESISQGESNISSLNLLLYNADNGQKENSYSSDESGELDRVVLSSAKGAKHLIAVTNCSEGDLSECDNLETVRAKIINLDSQRQDYLTMIGEQTVVVKGGINETSLNVTRLVGKIILKRVRIDKPYNKGHIKVTRAFMMNVNAQSKLRGRGFSPEVSNPVWQGYTDAEPNFMSALSRDIKITGNDKEDLCHFYVFENTRETSPTVLFIEAEYKSLQGNTSRLVYYPIVIKTSERNAILRNNVYTLSATIRRPGTSHPSIDDQAGNLEVNAEVEDWVLGEEKHLEFE